MPGEINLDTNRGVFQRMLVHLGLKPVQERVVGWVQKAGSAMTYEASRAQRVFSLNPGVRRLKELFYKYFPEGLFPESEAIQRLKARLSEMSFATDPRARANFLDNEEALEGMSLLRRERDHIPVSPAVFEAIVGKSQRDQETSFDDMLDHIIQVGEREDDARGDEVVRRIEEQAIALEEAAVKLDEEAAELERRDERFQAATKRQEAVRKRAEAAAVRDRVNEERASERIQRKGLALFAYDGAFLGEVEERAETAQVMKDARAKRDLISDAASRIEGREELEQFVDETAEHLATMLTLQEEGKRLLFMGKAGSKTVGLSGVLNIPGLDQHTPETVRTLLTEEDPKKIGEMAKQALVKKLGPQLLEFIGVANIRRIQQAHAEMHPGSELLDPVALFERYTGEAFARLEGVLNKQIPPEWTAEIVHSLKEDAREVICGPRRDVPPGDETGVERLYEKIASRGFEEVVERAVGETFVKIREVFSDKVDDFFAMATRFLPSSALTALTAQGIVPNIETPFWIDFVKEANGNYTVRFFANALGAEAFDEVTIDQKTGLRVPLIFENVPAEKLTKDFFRLLVDYEYRPKYKEEVHSYTPEHVVHGLKGILGEPSAAQSIQDLLPHVVVEERGALSLAQIYLFSNQDRDICVFYSEQSFDVLLNTFLDFWQEHGTVEELRKDRKLRLQMRNAINRIADEAILLHSDEVISTERLRSIYATIWEIEKVMHLAEKRRVQDEFRGGTVVPPGIQSHIKGLLLESGADPTYLEVVKETFLAAAGDDCEEIFDAALEELLPEIVSSKSITEAEVLDWKDIFKIETVKSKIAYLRMNRLSLLQLVKFYAKILVMLCMIYRVTLSAKTIQKTIEKYYPGIKKHLPFSTFHVGMMLTLFGPHFFAKTLPKDVYETLAAIYNLANDVSWYVFNRVLTNGFKQILKQVIPTEEKERVRNLAKTVQQEVLRKGELDYQVARSEGNADAVTLERHPMPLPAAFAAHVVTPLFQDDTPKPTATVLTAENYQDTIAGWIADAETLRARFGDEQNYHLIYLNEQIRNLKVPFGDTEDVWDEIMGCADELYAQAEAAESSADELRLTQQADQMRQRTINEALESVHTLLVALYAASENGQQIPQHRTETVISFYTLYAVIDALAKGSDNSGLTHFSHSANAADLCRYIQKAGVKVAHSKSLQQLRDLSHYYEFDLGERLTEEEIQKKFAFCHFNFDGSGTWLFGKAFSGEEETRRVSVTPWQTFRSVEHNYFSDLMKRPDVAQRLAAHGVTRETPLSEKLMILFRDPPRSEARVDRRGAIDATCSPGDPRKGILPREYYLLRLAHLMSSSRALFGEQLEETFLNAPMDQGLVISRVMVPDAAPTNIFATAKQWLYRARDVVTRGAFQAQAMRGNLAVLSQEARRVQAAKDRTIGRTLTGTGSEYTIGASQREQERYQKEEAFIGKRVSQSAVMAAMRQADSKSLLTVEEKRILEMVQSYDKDRLIRAIGLFSYRKERLRHPEFRLLFDLLCQNLIALEAQAQERVEVGRNIGKFFGETIDHFKNIGDLETALYMVRMGVELEGFFCSHDPALRAAFPDFAYEIREHIIPAYQERPEKKRKVCFGEAAQIDGIYLAVTTLANVYMNQDVESLGDVNKTIALMDIARFAFYQGRQHEEFLDQPLYREAKRVVYRNAAALKQLMMDQPGVRALVLDRVFADAGLNLPEGAWTGDFPTYTKQPDGPTIDLSERTIDGHESVYLREKGEEELRRIFRKEDLGPYDYIGLNTYYYPELGITIEWDDVTRRFEIQKEIDGEAALYYRQDEVTINWEFSPFTFEERDIIFISDSKIHVYRDGEEIVRFTTEADGAGLKVVKREHRINGGWHQAVDLRNQKHQLTLLNWFVDLEDIEAFSQPAQGEEGKERLTYFRLKKVGMEFKVEENGDGKFQAVSITEGTKGYVLCARQDDDRLYRYPHAILLRNETGAEKVILKSLPFATIFMKFVVNNVAGVKTSPMIDELVNTQVVGNYDKYIFGDINREAQQLQAQGGAAAVGGQALQAVYLDGIRRVAWDRPQFFTTHFDEKGELTSKDPNMLTYLTYYHFASGDIETALHYFEKLETYGKQYPFTEEALTYIDRLILLLGYSKEELGTELALRLAAIREKNVLIQMPTDVEQPVEEEGAPPRMKHDRLEILRSLVLQEKFCHYLESIKVGGRKYLTGEDELFIFKTLIRASKDLYKAQTEGVLTEEQQGYLRILGTDYVAQVLMSPTLVRRLHYLRAKHNEEEIWQSRRDRFLLEAVWYERTNPYTRFLGEPKRRGVLGQTNALAKEVLGSPLVRPHDIDYAEEMVTPTCSLEEVPVAFVEMDPRLLVTNFLHYYRLASGELPRDWIGNEEKQALFEAKREAFLKNYPLMRGNFSPKNFLFYDLLDRVATGSRSMVLESFLGKYPSADEIRVELLAVQGGTAALEARIAELEALPAQIGWITYREECMLERKRPSAFMSPNQMVPYNLHGRERAYVRQALEEGRGARYDAVVVAHQELEAYRMTYQEGLEDLRNEHRLAVDPMQIEDLERRIQQHEEAGLRRFQELEGRLKARTEACHAHFNEMMQKFVNQARADEGLRAVGSVVTIGNALGATRKTVSFGARLFTTPVKVGLRQLVMPLSAGLKERMEEALYSASPIPFTRQLVRGFSRVFRQEMEVMREAEGPVREPEKVSEELATVLNQREERITTALRELLEEYCVVTTTLNDPKEPIPEFNFEGLDDEAVAAGFQRFNAELQQFYARNPGETITFALREGRSAEEFIHAMKVLQEEVEGVLRQEREAIMKFVNQEKLEETDEEVRTLRRLEKVKAKHKPIQFYDMMKWFLTEDDAILLNRSETSPEHLPIIREKLYLYLLTASRFNLIFDKIGGANPERGIDALAAELLHERSYSIVAGDFARLLKAKLAYEAHKGVLLWEVQSTHLDRIVRERGTHVLNVMIMGDGKTTGVIPAEDYAEADGKERLVVNVWPKSVKGQCLDHMEANPYSQGVNAFIIDRKRNWDSERLWALVKVFRSALQHREQLNVTQEDLQSLLLRFIDEAVDIEERYRADSAEYKKRMGYYQQLILTIMDHITLNVDEIHEAAREDKELNFPLGKRRTLKVEDARALEEVILQLLTIPEIEQYITIKDAEPKVLPANVFEEHVAPVVAAKLVALSQLEIPVEHRDAIAAYLCGRSEEIPLCAVKHPQYKTLCMMRGALMVIIPKTLEELPHKHFNKASADNKVGGEERDIDVQYGKPSEGNMGTVEEADFLLPFKTFVASCVLFAKDRLNDEQVIRMIRYLQSNAEKEAKERGIHQDNTDVARQFREVLCPGVELFSIGEEVDAEVIEQLRQSDVVTLAYVREFVRPAIKYYPKLLESNGQDIMNLAKVLRMHTGTPEEELLPEETKAVAREGILGQSLHTFEARTKEVRVFSRSAPEEVLETDVIQGFFNLSRMHQAITDRGATLNGLTPEEVARKVWVGIRDVRTDVKGVVFFQKDRPMILTAAGVLALADSRVTPEEYVVIFDEIHTYAANVPLKDGAVILHTVGETTTFEKETDQAQYRARGIEKRGQKQIIAMTPHVRSRIIDEERIPTIRECGRFLGANGFKARSKRTFFIKCRKVESQVKHAIIEKAVRARSVEQMIAIFRAFTDVLVTDVSDNPVDLYGFLRVSVDSNVALRAMRDRLIAQLVTKQIGGTPVFSPEDLRELNASLTEVIEGRRFKLAEELYKVVQSRVIAKIEHAADRGPVATRYAAFLQLGVRAYLASFFDSEEGREENPLAILKNRVLQQVQTHYFTVEEVAEIEAQLNAIVAQDRAQAAQQVQAYSRTEGLSTDAITAMGRVVQVQVQNEAEEEEQQEQIEEVNNLQQAGLEDEHPVPPDEDIRWSSTIDPTNLDQWFHLMNPRDGFSRMGRYRGYTPPLFQLSEGLKLAESEAIRAFAETLSPAICCSWNMFKVFSSSVRGRVLEPFGDRQKPIFEALLVQNGAQQKIILVDQEEAEFWRGKLKEDREHLEGASVFGSRHLGQTLFRPSTDKAIDPNVKIALIDVHTGIIAATGANAVTEDDVNTYVMKRARAQCKLMAGYTNYTEAELEVVERWATHRGADRIINFFEPVAYAHHPKEKYDRSNLQELFFRLQDRVREPDLVRV